MKLTNIVNIIDVESTCWEPRESQPKDQISEIIEIGIAVVDTKDLSVLENASLYINPKLSKVSDFCARLTHLSQWDLDCHYDFPATLKTFIRDFKPSERTFISWGDYDRSMFESNCKEYGCKYPFGPRHLNFRHMFSLLHGLDKELTIPEALSLSKVTFKGIEHRGLDDSKNIADLLVQTLKKFRS